MMPRRRILLALRLLPLITFFLITVGVGLVHGTLQSFFLAGPPRMVAESAVEPGIQRMWAAYGILFSSPDLVASLVHTVTVALVSGVLAVAIGAVAAYGLWRAPRWVQRIGVVYRLPIILPHIVVGFLVMLVWARSGIVSAALARLGLIQGMHEFPQLLFSPSGAGMILAYVYKGFPFVMLLALGVLQRVPERLVVTAEMLGAGTVRVFFRVILPALAPILNQMFIILFLFALGGFDIPWMLGGSRPQMLPITVYSLYFQGTLYDRAVAMAALTLLACFAGCFVVLYGMLARRLRSWERVI